MIAGVVVLVIHDMSDFFMSIVRAVDDMKATPKWLTYSLFVLAVSSWTITRIYIFPKTIVY